MTDDALRQQWQAPLAGYKRERALQAQRMRNLGAMERALQRRASSSALAQHFVRGARVLITFWQIWGCFCMRPRRP